MIKPGDYPLWNSAVARVFHKTFNPEEMMVEGHGVRIRDVSGRWFLDARSGVGNVSLGYDDQRVIQAIKDQLDTLPYANMIGYGRPSAISARAAEALIPHLPPHLNKVRYCSNGSQAVETAVLLSRFLHRAQGAAERETVFALWHGHCGLGAGAGALTGLPYVHQQCGPLLPGVQHARGPFEPAGDGTGSDLERRITDYGPGRVAAVLAEPIIGEGGHVLPDDYLHSLQAFCRHHGIHLIIDEITTGMGRAGAFTRSQQIGLAPDILTLGKGLSAGYAPLSAITLSDQLYQQILDLPYDKPMFTGSTNDGHPLALAASIAVIDILATDGILDNVKRAGARLHRDLTAIAARHPAITAVRGTGLMYALELTPPPGTTALPPSASTLRLAMEHHGVLVSTLASWPAITIMPPLIITDDDTDQITTALEDSLTLLRY
jgi:adenosylmethionine-8-amino-7-oxononanoate aminotransferase